MNKIVKAKHILNRLKEEGWVLKHQRGSHAQYVHPTRKGKVTVNASGNDDVYGELLKSIEKQSGIKF